METKQLTTRIIELIGGEENIIDVFHCITRLRFTLKDEACVQIDEIKKLQGVVGAQFQKGQFQVIIGNEVKTVFEQLQSQIHLSTKKDIANKEEGKTKFSFASILEGLSSMFVPILPAIVGAGMIKGILALLTALHLLDYTGNTYAVLNIVSDVAFYFLPFLLAVSAARKFKVNEFLALCIAGSLLYPTIVNGINTGTSLDFVGINIPLISYSGSILPIIISVWMYSYLYRFIDKFIPNMFKIILTPTLSLLIMVPITLAFIGPVGNYAGVYLGQGLTFIFDTFGPFAGLVGGIYPLIVLTGMHYAIFPITANNLMTMGYDFIFPLLVISNLSQAGAALGAAICSKDKEFKTIGFTSSLSAVFGITEPAIYGVNLKLKKPFYASIIGGSVGGFVSLLLNVKTFAGVMPGITALPVFIEKNGAMGNLYSMCICMMVGFIVSFLLTMIFMKTEKKINEETHENHFGLLEDTIDTVYSPMNGTIKLMQHVDDKAFSSNSIGEGIAIVPKDGIVYAPFDGELIMIAPSKHAVGVRSHSGCEVLIHVGINSVNLQGEGFEILKKEKDTIKRGDEILRFDINFLKEKGVNLDTMIIVTNTKD
ncbi:MAG: beta-glucoside-specific PTS transporter subunit IIABC, partial [Longicatena sp.]